MHRTVTAHLVLDADDPTDLVLSVAVPRGAYTLDEELDVRGGVALDVTEIETRHGTRVHRVQAPAGRTAIEYRATVAGQDDPPPVAEADLVEYLRPSRYAESDKLLAFAVDQFGGLSGAELLDAVVDWVFEHLAYVPGSSGPTDGAIDTVLTRTGVCRDYAHLVVGLLRAMEVPARLVSVYAPGLEPMDFHAVAEAHVDGSWHVVDATRLAPRSTLLRIATGRDAADTAFLSSYGGRITLQELEVTATSAGTLPADDGTRLSVLR
ncbi:transglutaminase-like domain-containing protein [Oerskovia flava]|uniref:transglutaminase-like domain-containing protein n=1 Tax=Oerskovia flava TaxID=2986422 RepID=UPI00223FE91E|nr:transglutaminase family protein [Oerskovia sp. JB1-3-2]